MFGKFFKKGPSKNAASPVTADVLNTIDVFITVINDYSGEVEGLYREVGDEKAVKQLEAAALAGNFDERKLNAACTPLNPHVLTSTLKQILLAHQPLVPFEHVDVIVSSDDLTGVLHDLPAGHKETLEVFLRHVWTISRNRKPQMDLTALADQLTACILRRAGDDSKTVSPETKAAFKKLVSQKNDLFRSGVSKPGVSGVEDALAAKKGAPHADPAPDGNVMNRSVKITPPKGFPVITDEEVKSILGIFGEVHQVG